MHSVPPMLWHCWLGIRKSIQSAKYRFLRCWYGCRSTVWFSVIDLQIANVPSDATATPSSLASLKPRMVCMSSAVLPILSKCCYYMQWTAEGSVFSTVCDFFVMAALHSRCGHYIFLLWFFFLSIFFPHVISAVADWMFTILPRMVWP